MKLLDPSGANVWWWRRRDFSPPREGTRLVLRRASLDFASGPRSGGDPDRGAAVQLALASDRSAAGTLWVEGLRVEPRPPASAPPRTRSARASSVAPGHGQSARSRARARQGVRQSSDQWGASPRARGRRGQAASSRRPEQPAWRGTGLAAPQSHSEPRSTRRGARRSLSHGGCDGNQDRDQRIRSHRSPRPPNPLRSGPPRPGDRRRRRRRRLDRCRLLRLPDEVRLGARSLRARTVDEEERSLRRAQRRARRRRRRGEVHPGGQGPEPAPLEGARRGVRHRVDGPFQRRREGGWTPRCRGEEGDPLGARKGRGQDAPHGGERGRVRSRSAPRRVECLLHDELPGPRGARAPQGGDRARDRSHDHDPQLHRDAEGGGRPLEEGLARRPRGGDQHHPVHDRRGEGGGRGAPRDPGQAHRHGVPRADAQRLRRGPHRSARSRRPRSKRSTAS